MRIARWLVARALAALVIVAVIPRGHADPRIEKADQLFAEAQALMASDLVRACAKFDQSLHENPAAIGTLLNVALCDEKLGRVASAVARFTEARDHAKEQGLTEHQRAAEARLAVLEPVVPHLELQLTERLADTQIVIDDRVVPLEQLADVAVDPGERTLVVSAPNRLTYRARISVARAEHKRVVIPALERPGNARRRIGQLAVGVGVAALATGLGLGLDARDLYNRPFDQGLCQHVGDRERCQPDGQRATDHARVIGNVGTGVGIAGLVATGIGAYLWITAGSRAVEEARGKTITLVPQLDADRLGVSAIGRF